MDSRKNYVLQDINVILTNFVQLGKYKAKKFYALFNQKDDKLVELQIAKENYKRLQLFCWIQLVLNMSFLLFQKSLIEKSSLLVEVMLIYNVIVLIFLGLRKKKIDTYYRSVNFIALISGVLLMCTSPVLIFSRKTMDFNVFLYGIILLSVAFLLYIKPIQALFSFLASLLALMAYTTRQNMEFQPTMSYLLGIIVLLAVLLSLNGYSSKVTEIKLKTKNNVLMELVNKLRVINEGLKEISSIDHLTTIANRRKFDLVLDAEWRRARRTGAPLSLIMLDIDYFKEYNDFYGHIEGDRCLKAIGNVLKNTLKRSGDFPARYGGEEFACILTDTNKEDAIAICQCIQKEIKNLSISHGSSKVSSVITASFGVVCYDNHQDIQEFNSPVDLLKQADKVLYEAKSNGRNRIEVYSRSLSQNIIADLMEQEVVCTLKTNSIV